MKRLLAVLILSLTVLGCNSTPSLEFPGGIVYYEPPATSAEGEKLGDFFVEFGYFGDLEGGTRKVKLEKDEDSYRVRCMVRSGAEKEPEFVAAYTKLRRLLTGHVFEGAIVEVEMCDIFWRTLRLIHAGEGSFTE